MNEYRRMILEGMQKRYPEHEFSIGMVKGNNGCNYIGICAKLGEDNPCTPIIPCEKYEKDLQEGKYTLEYVLEDMVKQFEERKSIRIRDFSDYSQIKGMIFIHMVNYELNKEYLKIVPHRRWMDLAVTYRMELLVGSSTLGVIPITNARLEVWNMTEEELFQDVYANLFVEHTTRIRSLEQAYIEDFGEDDPYMEFMVHVPEEEEQYYIADMEYPYNGAACVLDTSSFREFAKKKGKDLYIVPASVHRVIVVVKDDTVSVERFSNILEASNIFIMPKAEVLSYHIYQYCREQDEITDVTVSAIQ